MIVYTIPYVRCVYTQLAGLQARLQHRCCAVGVQVPQLGLHRTRVVSPRDGGGHIGAGGGVPSPNETEHDVLRGGRDAGGHVYRGGVLCRPYVR